MQMAVTEKIGKGGLNGEPRKEGGGRKGEAKETQILLKEINVSEAQIKKKV